VSTLITPDISTQHQDETDPTTQQLPQAPEPEQDTPEPKKDAHEKNAPNNNPPAVIPAPQQKQGNRLGDFFGRLLTREVVKSGLVGKGQLQLPPPPIVEEQITINDIVIHAGMSIGDLVNVLSAAKGDDEEVINSFEEDAEHPAGNAVRNIMIAFFYIVPAIAALGIGVAVGVKFAGSGWLSLQGLAILTMCIVFEAIPILLMLATAKLISRVLAGVKRALLGAVASAFLFIVIALGSSVAQWVLFEGKINYADFAQFAGAIIRTLALPLAEIAAAVALPILRRKSLDEYLAVIKKKNDAKIAINQQRIKSKLDVISAAMTTKSDLQKEEDYQKKLELANKLIDLVTGKVIKDTEKSINGDVPQTNDRSYRRDGMR